MGASIALRKDAFMNLVSSNIPLAWTIVFWLGFLGLLAGMVRYAAWPMLADRDNQRVFLLATSAVLGIWFIKAGVKPGLDFHLLGASMLTLMFRPWFAILSLALVTGALTLHSGEYAAYPANLMLMGVLPVLVTWSIYRLADARLPNHLFIYIFLNGFFGSALAIATVGVASTLFAAATGAYALEYLVEEYLPFYFLMAWAEAFATGMLITLMVVYRPEWVATFDDRRYLHSR